MVKERSQQLLPATDLFERVQHLVGEGLHVVRNVVGQVGVLGMRSDLLHGVEVRGVGTEAIGRKACFRSAPPAAGRPIGAPTNDPGPG